MPTHDMVIDNAVGATVRADMNSALAALVANSSSATEPATMYAYMFWADTTADILKQRNAANSAWVNILTLSTGVALGNAALAQIQSGELVNVTATLTGTEYAATPSPAITAYATGQTFNVIFDLACPAAPTLKLNGIATPPDLVRQNLDGSYETLNADDFPAGWQSPVKLVSATQALVLVLPRITKIISGTRDLTAASGNVAYTGFGATPKAVRMIGAVNSTTVTSNGFANAAQKGCVYTNYAGAATAASVLAGFVTASGNNQTAVVASLTKDTVTLTWAKTSSPTGTATFFLEVEY